MVKKLEHEQLAALHAKRKTDNHAMAMLLEQASICRRYAMVKVAAYASPELQEDLEQEFRIGCFIAIEKWEPARGPFFHTVRIWTRERMTTFKTGEWCLSRCVPRFATRNGLHRTIHAEALAENLPGDMELTIRLTPDPAPSALDVLMEAQMLERLAEVTKKVGGYTPRKRNDKGRVRSDGYVYKKATTRQTDPTRITKYRKYIDELREVR